MPRVLGMTLGVGTAAALFLPAFGAYQYPACEDTFSREVVLESDETRGCERRIFVVPLHPQCWSGWIRLNGGTRGVHFENEGLLEFLSSTGTRTSDLSHRDVWRTWWRMRGDTDVRVTVQPSPRRCGSSMGPTMVRRIEGR